MARLTRWLLASITATTLVAGAAQAQAQEPEKESRFVMVTHGVPSDPFWSVVKNGAEAAAELVGARLEYRAPSTFDMAMMQQLVQAAVASNPDGLILSFTDEN
ncbi:unnamed protein product, partial [Ectocarpus sp. 12 AP-2014]